MHPYLLSKGNTTNVSQLHPLNRFPFAILKQRSVLILCLILIKLQSFQQADMTQRLKNLSAHFVHESTDFLDFLSLLPKNEKHIIEKVNEWGKQHLTTSQINECYETASFPQHLIKPLQELDIAKYFVGSRGGHTIHPFTQGMILAVLASYDASVALFLMLQSPLCGRTLQRLGSEAQKDKYILDLLKLNKIWGWALTEESIGSYASQIETNVKKTSNGYILNGNKRWIGNGDGDYLVVYAKNLDEKKINGKCFFISGFVVDMKSEGIRRHKIQHKLGMRSVQNCQIYFKNVHLPNDSLLPQATSYRKGVEKILMSSRFNVIFITYGVCMGVYRNAIAYTSNREQFKVPITSFQLVQQKLVKIMSNVQAIGMVCWRVASMQENGQNTIGIIAMFKSWVTERARQISRWGRQIMGGNGITHDRYIMKAIADIEALYTLEGTYEINTLIAGRQITGMPAFKPEKSFY